jgi:hypothetical protein
MRHRSKKQEALYKERRPLVKRLLEENPACKACLVRVGATGVATVVLRQSVDIHELLRRSQGGSILDEKNLLAVCRECHTWITGNPAAAEQMGLHLPGWAKDDMWEEAGRVRESWAEGQPTAPYWLVDGFDPEQ